MGRSASPGAKEGVGAPQRGLFRGEFMHPLPEGFGDLRVKLLMPGSIEADDPGCQYRKGLAMGESFVVKNECQSVNGAEPAVSHSHLRERGGPGPGLSGLQIGAVPVSPGEIPSNQAHGPGISCRNNGISLGWPDLYLT